jgi:hypothetical protein
MLGSFGLILAHVAAISMDFMGLEFKLYREFTRMNAD